MATPLKDSFSPDVAVRIGEAIRAAYATFLMRDFLSDALNGFDDLELTPRARHIARALRTHLPDDYEAAVSILTPRSGRRARETSRAA